MKILHAVLLLVIIAESAYLITSGRLRPVAPRPLVEFHGLDPATEQELHQAEDVADYRTPDGWLDLAAMYRAYGLLPAASYCYEQADKLSPNDPAYLVQWGLCLSRLGDTRRAGKQYERAIEAGVGNLHTCWYMMGRDLLREEKPDEAEPFLRKAASQEPMAEIMLIRLLMRTDRTINAAALLDDLLRREPLSLAGHQMKAWAEEELGNVAVARQHERRLNWAVDHLSRLHPGAAEDEAMVLKFGADRQASEAAEAVERGDLQAAKTLSQASLDARWQEAPAMQLVQINKEIGDEAGALAVMDDLLERIGPSAERLGLRGDVLSHFGREDQARASWSRATRFFSTIDRDASIKLYSRLTDSYKQAGDADLETRYRALYEYETGKVAWWRGNVQEARERFRAAIGTVDHANAWYWLAEASWAVDDRAAAEGAYNECVKRNPDHGRALYRLDELRASSESGLPTE